MIGSGTYPLARFALQAASTIGVTKVVHDIIRNNTDIVVPAHKAMVWVGTFVIGGMVTDQAATYVDGKVDKFIEWNELRKAADAEIPNKTA